MIWFWIFLTALIVLSTYLIMDDAKKDMDSTIRNWPNTIEEEDK